MSDAEADEDEEPPRLNRAQRRALAKNTVKQWDLARGRVPPRPRR